MVYYYQGEKYCGIGPLMEAVRLDIDGYLGDSDLDSVIRERGGSIVIGGNEFRTALSLKENDPGSYREFRNGIIDGILEVLTERAEEGYFPIDVPYASTTIESSRSLRDTIITDDAIEFPWQRLRTIRVTSPSWSGSTLRTWWNRVW